MLRSVSLRRYVQDRLPPGLVRRRRYGPLEKVQAEFDAALREQSNKGIDPTRMRDIIARQKRKTLAACEDDPCALLVSPVLKHFIYADQRDETTTLKELGDALGLLEYAQSLEIETWEADLQKLASSADERVWVVSRLSAAEASRQRDEEESRKQATIKGKVLKV